MREWTYVPTTDINGTAFFLMRSHGEAWLDQMLWNGTTWNKKYNDVAGHVIRELCQLYKNNFKPGKDADNSLGEVVPRAQ